ncbi:caspase family protein [Thiocapsa sp.]|uniref:caspase family protein n=1 Tax=Thiocapsa sp. TaxID=2024551 RepID=UPI003593F24D
MQKAAIVIGVNRTGDLPVLNAAVSGAVKIAAWLRKEGFQVKPFLDTTRSVVAGDLYTAIAKLVDRGTLEQLVIYFSGHGCDGALRSRPPRPTCRRAMACDMIGGRSDSRNRSEIARNSIARCPGRLCRDPLGTTPACANQR